MSALEAGDTGDFCADLKRKGSRDELSDHRSAGENWGQACDQSHQLMGGRHVNAAPQTNEVMKAEGHRSWNQTTPATVWLFLRECLVVAA